MKNLKQIFLPFLFLFLAIGMLSGCSSRKDLPPATKETLITKEVKTVERDTTFTTKPDSSSYEVVLAYKDGKIVLTDSVKTEAGVYVKKPKVTIRDNVLTVDCYAEAQKLFAKWKETYTTENKATIEQIPYPVPAQLTWLQQTLIKLGWAFIVLSLAAGCYFLFKILNPKIYGK